MTEDKPIELLPCPFCGGKAEINDHWLLNKRMYFYSVSCSNAWNCSGWQKGTKTKQEAVDIWNTRAPIRKDETYDHMAENME